jgi:antitoxin (DNA-binding transcriptional repressor) of toxin-antitoxin stability system
MDGHTIEVPERHVGIRELRGNLTRYLNEARQGASILVTLHDEVIAEIRAPSITRRLERQPGSLRGQIRMEDDFDTLPEDILATMEA